LEYSKEVEQCVVHDDAADVHTLAKRVWEGIAKGQFKLTPKDE
jgi:hypothetical protein